MQPLVRAAVAAAALAALTRAAQWALPADDAHEPGRAAPSSVGQLPSLCPPGTLPDGNVCVPVPAVQPTEQPARTRSLQGIARRPDRPADYRRYQLPLALDKQGRLSGTEVRCVELDGQVEHARIQYVGRLIGQTVVTRHRVHEAGQLRQYLVIYGHLQSPAPGLREGAAVRAGTRLGSVQGAAAPRSSQRLQVRRTRPGVKIERLSAKQLLLDLHTVACDPRNVFPLKAPAYNQTHTR